MPASPPPAPMQVGMGTWLRFHELHAFKTDIESEPHYADFFLVKVVLVVAAACDHTQQKQHL